MRPSSEHYERLVVNGVQQLELDEVRYRSAALMSYFLENENSIPYRYTFRGLTNQGVKRLHWIEDDLRTYKEMGDPNVAFIADRIEGLH